MILRPIKQHNELLASFYPYHTHTSTKPHMHPLTHMDHHTQSFPCPPHKHHKQRKAGPRSQRLAVLADRSSHGGTGDVGSNPRTSIYSLFDFEHIAVKSSVSLKINWKQNICTFYLAELSQPSNQLAKDWFSSWGHSSGQDKILTSLNLPLGRGRQTVHK